MSVIHVTNEVGRLRKVLLHRPGSELLNLTPNNFEKLLFDDIPYLEKTIKEHDNFSKVLKENGVEVVYLEDLMSDVISINDIIREKFIKQFVEEAEIGDILKKMVVSYLITIKDSKKLVLKTMEGIKVDELIEFSNKPINDLYSLNNYNDFVILPMPNLYFIRDIFSSVMDGININKMNSSVRYREGIYTDYIFNYHPIYKNVEKYYGRSKRYSIEGGDILLLNDHTLMIGCSLRTEYDAIISLAREYFSSDEFNIDTILITKITSKRTFMHLDTVFTQVDKYKFLYYSKLMNEAELSIIKKEKNNKDDFVITDVKDSLEKTLENIFNHPIELISCAGGDSISSQREQWSDGANSLCIYPGCVIVYDRNNITNDVLRSKGIKVIEIESGELSRGRGGPRCMSMPLVREDIDY